MKACGCWNKVQGESEPERESPGRRQFLYLDQHATKVTNTTPWSLVLIFRSNV